MKVPVPPSASLDEGGPFFPPPPRVYPRWRRLALAGWRRLQPPRRVWPTREGWGFVVIGMTIALAALNTGNNLLYLVFSMMLSLFALSGVLSELAIGRVRVERTVPERVVAGEAARFVVRLSNPRRRWGQIAVTLREVRARSWEGSAAPAFFAHVPAGGESPRAVEYTFPRRGLHRLAGFEVSTSYPFGLVRKSYRIPLAEDVVVLPGAATVAPVPVPPAEGEGARASGSPGEGGDLRGLRELRDGEDARHIHWKASARRGRLIAVETTGHERRTVVVRLAAASSDGREGVVSFERAVREASALVGRHAARGDQVGLDTPIGAIPAAAGRGHETALLRCLALQPERGHPR